MQQITVSTACFEDVGVLHTAAADTAIHATVASGIRSIYAYCFTGRVDSWSPFILNDDFIAPFTLPALRRLATSAPFGDGRVKLGVAFDGWFLPHDLIRPLFDEVKNLGIKHVTTHNAPSPPGEYLDLPSLHEFMDFPNTRLRDVTD